jgi:hypothetical protein
MDEYVDFGVPIGDVDPNATETVGHAVLSGLTLGLVCSNAVQAERRKGRTAPAAQYRLFFIASLRLTVDRMQVSSCIVTGFLRPQRGSLAGS